MARFIRCPRCQNTLDVTNAAGGSTVRCSKCSALVRVPTGQTGPVPAQKPQAKPATRSGKKGTAVVRRGRSTPLFRKMQTAGSSATTPGSRGGGGREGTRVRKKSGMHPGIIAGIAIGAIVLVVIVVIVATSGKTPPSGPPQTTDETPLVAGDRTAITGTAENLSNPDATPVSKKSETKETKQPSMVKTSSGKYDVPEEFEPGATKQTSAKAGLSQEDMDVSDELLEEVTAKLRHGSTDELTKDEVKYIGAIICCMISEEKEVAYNAFKYLHDYCSRNNLLSEETKKNPVELSYFNSAYWRGGEWAYWSSEWYPKNKLRIVNPGDEGKVHVSGNAKTADWDKLMSKLRAGGAYDDIDRPEGLAFATVKSMGREAYPHLAKYIDHEDPMLGRAAVTVLNQLTGRDTRYTPGQKETCKRDWEAWIEKN